MTRTKNGPSDRVRAKYDWAMFRAIPVGGTFRFASEVEWVGSGVKRGVCEKVSARKYRYVEDGVEGTVGSIDAVVIRLDESGEPKVVGEYVPYLGD